MFEIKKFEQGVTFVVLHFFLCFFRTSFTVKIFQKLSLSYLFYLIKQLTILLFFELFSTQKLNQVAEKNSELSGFLLGDRKCKHVILLSMRFNL